MGLDWFILKQIRDIPDLPRNAAIHPPLLCGLIV
jgi:hypothetical protein